MKREYTKAEASSLAFICPECGGPLQAQADIFINGKQQPVRFECPKWVGVLINAYKEHFKK